MQRETRIPTKLPGSTSRMGRGVFFFFEVFIYGSHEGSMEIGAFTYPKYPDSSKAWRHFEDQNNSAKNRFKSFHWRVLPAFC